LAGAAGEGEGYLWRVDTEGEFEKISVVENLLPGVERTTKYTIPASGDSSLLPPVFQNANLYRFHLDFLAAEFSQRFPGLTHPEYLALVERRATRSYFAGVVYRFSAEGGPIYGFDVFTAGGDPDELPRLEEVRWIHGQLQPAFGLDTIAYSPSRADAIRNAEEWIDPGFPVHFGFGGGLPEFIPYTRGESYGRLRVLTPEEFEEANEVGTIVWQDIVILQEAPSDIEGVVAGVITGEIQGELSHLAIRTARRGTPNAYLRDGYDQYREDSGKLVHLQVKADGIEIQEASPEEAGEWWDAHRPRLEEIPPVDPDHDSLDAVWEISSPELQVARYGGKASNFAQLQRLLDEKHRVRAFVIPFSYYLRFLEANTAPSLQEPGRRVSLGRYIEELLSDPQFRSDPRRRYAELDSLRRMIKNGEVDESTVKKIALRIEAVFGSRDFPVRFRSSSNVEDLIEFNGAGLYESTSACAADDLDEDEDGPSHCDLFHSSEWGIARALRQVWGSLWNYRAFEEREYYQIDQRRAAMAILVSEAVLDEECNGVAFTGNPSVRGDRRFLINVQLGEIEVVHPDPGVVAEKDILEMEKGSVKRIIRARPSSLAAGGEWVLDDERLRELGAAMATVEGNFQVDPGSHGADEVLLDFEFKVDRRGQLRIKQVRPFLIPEFGNPVPEFHLQVPEGTEMCGSFLEGRKARDVLAAKAILGFRGGTQVLRADGTGTADLVEWIQLGPEGPRFPARGPGVWHALFRANMNGFEFSMVQEFDFPGEPVRLNVETLALPASSPREVLLDPESLTWGISPLLFHCRVEFGDPPDVLRDVPILPCNLDHLPLWLVDVEFAGGHGVQGVHLEERFHDLDVATGPAELVRARVAFAGEERTVTDYWRLVYSGIRHNEDLEHWILFDPAVHLEGIGEAGGLAVRAGSPPGASLLDGALEELAPLEILAFDRREEGASPIPRFRRGDANSSGELTITDGILILRHVFEGKPLACPDAGDIDDWGTVDIDDALLLLFYLFFDFDPPAPPGPDHCGADNMPDDLPECDGKGCS